MSSIFISSYVQLKEHKAGNTISDHPMCYTETDAIDGLTSDTDLYRAGEALVAFPTVAVVRKDTPAPI